MSQFILNIDGSVEQDKVFVCDRLLNRQGEIYPIEDLHTVMKLSQNDEVNFKVYKYNDGEPNPFWDKIDDIRIILVEGKGYFEIATPLTVEECAYKQVKGISLGEAEASQTNVTLQINTEDDIARENYKKAILYDSSCTYTDIGSEGSLLHRLFRSMPHYTIGHVDASVACIQRTFSCENQTVYDFLQTIAEEMECIFIFDNFKREVNCYDLKDHCNRQSCITANNYRNVKKGVCQCCNSSDYITYGYGKDTGVFIDSDNLVESVTLTGDKDSVKNCFKIEGADDTITNLLRMRLMDGNYIWKFSPYQTAQMSPELQQALIDHNVLVKSYQHEYNTVWDNYNNAVDQKLYYESGMMPSMQSTNTNAQSVHNTLFGAGGKITYACKSSEHQTSESVLRSIKSFAKQIIPKEYDIELTLGNSSSSSISFTCKIALKDTYKDDKTQVDEYTSNVSMSVIDGWRVYYNNTEDNPVFTTDYFMYLKQMLEKSLEASDTADDVISFEPKVAASYDEKNDPQNLSAIHYSKYCYNRLKSFRDAYEACTQVLAKYNEQISGDIDTILKYVNQNGNQVSIYNDLVKKYYDRIAILDERMAYLEGKINSLKSTEEFCGNRLKEIREICKMENFLKNYKNGSYGDNLWIELCSFKREDTYRNDNYIGEGVDYTTLIENVEGLIKRATEELETACEISYSINTTIGNLLTMKEFEPLWDDFTIGNWIRIRVDEDIYKLRLISVTFDYSDLSHISVEFSDVTKSENPLVDLKSLFQQAASMATNFNSVTKQAEKGYMTNQEFAIMKEAGLDIANTMITNADNEEFVIDRYGITGRVWNDTTNTYDDEQLREIHNLICFTSDGWKHTRLALGKIYYYDNTSNPQSPEWKWAYGLNAEVLIANLIMSALLKIINKSGTYTIDDTGFHIVCGDNRIEINAIDPSITISKIENGNEHIYMRYSPTDGLIIDGTGKFSGYVLVGNATGKHIILDPKNPSMVINDGKENIFDFNSDGSGVLTITAGIITSILKSKDYKKYTSGMCIDLQNKSLEIYDANNKELLSYNLDNNGIFRVAGWKIDKEKIYSDNNNSYINLYSNGNIESYTDTGEKYHAKLEKGVYRFSTYNDPSKGWIELSNDGLWAVSKNGYGIDDGGSEPLFRIDTNKDIVKIISHSNEPGLHIQNKGTGGSGVGTQGDTFFCENWVSGQENKTMHGKVYVGENQADYAYFSVFGERGDNNGNKRLVVRADIGDDHLQADGTMSPAMECTFSALGTTTYPWGEIHGAVFDTRSDLKKKDVIGTIDKKEALDFINALKPIKYTLKSSTKKRIHMGFGAQHVAKTVKDLDMGDLALYTATVVRNSSEGEYYDDSVDDENLAWTLRYDEFEAPMVSAIQALYEMVAEQSKEIKAKDTIIEEQNEKIDDLEERLKRLENIIQKQGLA